MAGQRKPPTPRSAHLKPIPAPPVQPKAVPATSETAQTAPAKREAVSTSRSGTASPPRPRPTGTATAASTTATSAALTSTARRSRQRRTHQGGVSLVLVVLAVLTLLAATAVTVLIVERVTTPPRLDPELLPAAEDAYSAMYSFDYTEPEASVEATLAVLTGELREQFQADLDAQVVPSYLEVSATTRVDNITVGLQSINDEQIEAVVVAYGTFVVKSTVSGQQGTPEGSECAVTPDGAEACVQTLQLNLEKVDGIWLVSAVTTITTA